MKTLKNKMAMVYIKFLKDEGFKVSLLNIQQIDKLMKKLARVVRDHK